MVLVRSQGQERLEIGSMETSTSGAERTPFRRLSWEEIRFLSHELESITRGGFPMVPALASLARDMRRSRLKSVMEELRESLMRGESLDQALQRQADRFPPVLLALIRAGEAAGNLPGVLALLSTHARSRCRANQALTTAMIYPMVLVTTSIALLGYLLVCVVPPFQDTFVAFNITPPGITLIFFEISRILRVHGAMIGASLLALVLGGVILMRIAVHEDTRRYWSGTLLLMSPCYGRIHHAVLQARFGRTLCLLLKARVPAVDSIILAGAAAGSALAERASRAASAQVAQGERISDALRDTGFFSHKFCWLIGAGEDRGGLEDALDHIAENLEREVESSELALSALAAPLITVMVGGMAVAFLLAFYLPIYGAGKSLGVE